MGVWRNGSASDSRSEGWEFESLSALIFVFCLPEALQLMGHHITLTTSTLYWLLDDTVASLALTMAIPPW
jgi:hypothetical protein